MGGLWVVLWWFFYFYIFWFGMWCLVFGWWVFGVWLGYVLGWLQKLQSYFYGVFCVEKLRNLDLCLFGTVTFVTFVTFVICVGTLEGLEAFVCMGVWAWLPLGTHPSIEAALAL